jgi:hypothetical protein
MTGRDSSVDQFLSAIKAEGRSSPAGMHWNQFYEFLRARSKPGEKQPPVPLILAASGEPDSEKHARLRGQLEWAMDNGCLVEAIGYLERLPADKWNAGPLERWGQDSY